jgi:hypothetical protein
MRGREITPHFLSEPEAIVYIGETQPPMRRRRINNAKVRQMPDDCGHACLRYEWRFE